MSEIKEKLAEKLIKLKLNKYMLLLLGSILCLQIITLLYYGTQKQGFHEDEYYSYYSTNRTAGLYEPDREWMERDTYRNEFVVLEGERFNYGLVSTVQSWDVHPPFYYFILHTVCSFFPGVFGKWLGIGVNIFAFALSYILLAWLSYMVTDRNKPLTLLTAVIYGFNAANISGVMFIRMYQWLTVFVLLCACLHVRAVKKKRTGFRDFLLPLMAVTYLGFLTQYYYIIFLVFMAGGYCFLVTMREKNLQSCIKYGMSCGAALLLAVISYPASLSHILRGYRGTGAVSEFINGANTGDRLSFFGGLVNEYLFDGWLWLWVAVLAFFAVISFFREKKRGGGTASFQARINASYFIVLFAVCGYFFTVSKTALLLYETSNRYQLPVYGMIQLLIITALYHMGKRTADSYSWNNRVRRMTAALGFALFLLTGIHGLASGKVIFLYEEQKAQLAYARENADQTVIVLYNDATPYNVWRCAQELMEYERIFFVSEADKGVILDEAVCGSGKIIVYAADYETQKESLDMVLESNRELTDYRLVAQKPLWSIYEFN